MLLAASDGMPLSRIWLRGFGFLDLGGRSSSVRRLLLDLAPDDACEPGLWATLLGVLRSRPSSNQGVDQSLALLMIENFGVGVRAKETGEDGLELADGHTAVGGHGDELGERR